AAGGSLTCCGLLSVFKVSKACQSSPQTSVGCMVRSAPLPHPNASTEQWRSRPQQIRSGCAVFNGNFLAMTTLRVTHARLYWTPFFSFALIRIKRALRRGCERGSASPPQAAQASTPTCRLPLRWLGPVRLLAFAVHDAVGSQP